MTGVMKNFYIASMFTWVAPVAILYGFNHNLFLGSGQLSSYSLTLVSGFLAVISVNMVIATYVYIAMKEQNSDKQKPDPKVLAEAKAKASASQFQSNETKENSSSTRFKRE